MLALIRYLFHFVWTLIVMIAAMGLLAAGMLFGGFYMLDILVKGEEIATPRVVGLPESEAIKRLIEHGLFPDPIEEIISDVYERGIVIDQRPFPGSAVKKGRRVALTVSSGPRRVLIPNLVGRRQADLIYDLRSAGLEPGTINQVYHPAAPRGEVIAQDPPSGAQMAPARQVNVLVSLGPPSQSFVMPNYIGVMKEEALRQILRQPFVRDDLIELVTEDPNQWDRIIRQRPEPGARISEGDAITLWVGVRAQPTAPPSPEIGGIPDDLSQFEPDAYDPGLYDPGEQPEASESIVEEVTSSTRDSRDLFDGRATEGQRDNLWQRRLIETLRREQSTRD